MKKSSRYVAMALAVLTISSCSDSGSFLDSPRSNQAPSFTALNDVIEVEAASFLATESVQGTLCLKSNVSWTGNVSGAAHWLDFDQLSDINVSGSVKEYAIPVTFLDNKESEAREVTVSFSSRGGRGLTIIRQKGFVPVLKVEGATSFDDVPAKGGDYAVPVVCNTDWTASALMGASAAVEVLNTAGSKSGVIAFTVGENDDAELNPSSQIKISATGCEDIIISITQNKATL